MSLPRSPELVAQDLARRLRELRLRREWTQQELAERSGISTPTVKLFERTGQITLKRLLLMARSLDALAEFDQLFMPPVAESLDELERQARRRARGKRRRK